MKTPSKEIVLNTAIGQRIFELLNLKISKSGKIKTSYGDKTIEGIGATISQIIEEQKEVTTANYNRDEILQIHANMRKYGGGCISALSDAIVRADQENLKKIQNAFPDEFEKYLKF